MNAPRDRPMLSSATPGRRGYPEARRPNGVPAVRRLAWTAGANRHPAFVPVRPFTSAGPHPFAGSACLRRPAFRRRRHSKGTGIPGPLDLEGLARRCAATGAGDAALPVESGLHVINQALASVAFCLGQAYAALEQRTGDRLHVALHVVGVGHWCRRGDDRRRPRGATAQRQPGQRDHKASDMRRRQKASHMTIHDRRATGRMAHRTTTYDAARSRYASLMVSCMRPNC